MKDREEGHARKRLGALVTGPMVVGLLGTASPPPELVPDKAERQEYAQRRQDAGPDGRHEAVEGEVEGRLSDREFRWQATPSTGEESRLPWIAAASEIILAMGWYGLLRRDPSAGSMACLVGGLCVLMVCCQAATS